MTDGNKYYLDKREAEQEEYDFKDEYEEIAADNVSLEAEVKKYHDAWLEAEAQVVELGAKLAKAAAFVHDFACRAKTDEHTQDEMWLIDEDTLRYQRDCDITQARTTLAELSSDSCAITKGEQDE